MFRTVPLSIIRSSSLYTQQWYMSYSLRAGSGRNSLRPDPARKLSANLYVVLCVQWKTPDNGQRNCPKHVEFYSKNKFEKLVHLVGFIIRIYHDARSPELRIDLRFIAFIFVFFSAIAFFDHINLVYGTISEFCTMSGCPDMTGPGLR